MTEEEHVRLIRRMFDAFARGDIPAVLDLLCDDIEWAVQGPSSIPYAGKWRGKGRVQEFFKKLSEATELLEFVPAAFIAEKNRVVVLGHEKGRARKTSREYDNPWAMVYTFNQGKVAGFREYIDTAAVAGALAADT